MKRALQHPPTSQTLPHWQWGTRRIPFERDITCNININKIAYLNLSDNAFKVTTGVGKC